MVHYLVRRLLGLLPTLLIVAVLVFLFVHLLPGDPARLAAGVDAGAETVELVRRDLGLDRPLPQQFVRFFGHALQGDFGRSIRTKRLVSDEIADRFGPTLWLTVAAMGWSVVLGLVLGVVSAVWRNRWPDRVGMTFAVSGISFPSFALGMVLMQLFSVQLGWLPTVGADSWRHYILPSLTLGASVAAVMARFTRSSFIDVLKEDYVRTARAKGLNERTVVLKHALRNALTPIITLGALELGTLLSGAVLTEQVFTIPGFGKLIVDAVFNRDYSVVQGVVLVTATAYMLLNLLADLAQFFVNPRLRR
jgi:glutathione transport system permease protein